MLFLANKVHLMLHCSNPVEAPQRYALTTWNCAKTAFVFARPCV
jgi:hypothetical protein